MTEAELKKANFIDGEMQKRFYANGEKITVEDVEFVYDVAFEEGRKEQEKKDKGFCETVCMKGGEIAKLGKKINTLKIKNKSLEKKNKKLEEEYGVEICKAWVDGSNQERIWNKEEIIECRKIKEENEKLKAENKTIIEDNDTLNKWVDELKAQIEKMKADVSNLVEHQGVVYANDIAVMYSKWQLAEKEL